MLYNGVPLPSLPNWDENEYPYAFIVYQNDTDGDEFNYDSFVLYVTKLRPLIMGNGVGVRDGGYGYSQHFTRDDPFIEWDAVRYNDGATISGKNELLWTNTDILNSDGTLFLSASAPIAPNTPVIPDIPDYPVINAALVIETVHAGDDFMSSAVSVSDLESTEAVYSFRANLSTGGEVISTIESDVFSGPFMYWHITKSNLTPETEYTLECVLLENGEETSVIASQTFTTLATETDAPVDDTQSLSLLSAILSAIKSHADIQEQDSLTIISWLEMSWLRLRNIEENAANILAYIKDLAPSKEETALKESVKDTTKEVTDSLFADDAPTKVTASDVKDVAQIGVAASSMFDFGVSVSSFFDAINDISLIALFTEKSKNDIYAVNEITTYGIDSGNQVVDYYTENLNKIKEFVGGDG